MGSSSIATAAANTLGALVFTLVLLLAPAPATAAASTTSSVSQNWGGYVATPGSRGQRFAIVSGSWTEPRASCIAGAETNSAAWVGLGGYSERSSSLEQIGSEANCSPSGAASYGLWYELLPAGPVHLRLRLRPGDRLEASVHVIGHAVRLYLADVSTGQRFTTTRGASRIDESSAEWIVEAPSLCLGQRACSILPLTNFGTLEFSSAFARTRAHSAPALSPYWSTTALELEQQAHGGSHHVGNLGIAPSRTLTSATPSSIGAPYGAFDVTYAQQQLVVERPAPPALPGVEVGASS